jgi:hypothetical protein
MRTDDEVRVLLDEASAELPEPDLADKVWADATVIGRRRRRRTTLVAGVALVGLVAAAAVAAPKVRVGEQVAPSPQPEPPQVSRTLPSAGTIDGMRYWLAPPAGSEAWLDRTETPLGDRLGPPPERMRRLSTRPIDRVGAVMLVALPGTGKYRPVILSARGRWASSDLELLPTKNSAGNASPPLDPTAVSPAGSLVAFAQPNQVVVLDTTTGEARRIPVPSATIEDVAWMPSGDRLLASGDGGTFRVTVGRLAENEKLVEQITKVADPRAATPPLALVSDRDGEAMVEYDVNGGGKVEQRLSLPVARWTGSTFTSGALAARAFVPEQLPELRSAGNGAQVVAVVEADPQGPGKLLVLPDSQDTGRATGCCPVLGWYDDHTVLVVSRTSGDSWVLGWDVLTGQVTRVAELDAAEIALGPDLVS